MHVHVYYRYKMPLVFLDNCASDALAPARISLGQKASHFLTEGRTQDRRATTSSSLHNRAARRKSAASRSGLPMQLAQPQGGARAFQCVVASGPPTGTVGALRLHVGSWLEPRWMVV